MYLPNDIKNDQAFMHKWNSIRAAGDPAELWKFW